MDTSISSATSCYKYFTFIKFRQYIFYNILHTCCIFLPLPAVIIIATVGAKACFIINILSASVPALQASRLNTVDAINGRHNN